ncbi:MAG: hypothetical protein AAGE05_04270 [Pseudomonadota bacterium]
MIALDNLYVEIHGGVPVCPTCGQPLDQKGEMATVLIANYRETKPPKDAIHSRLDHVLDFMEMTDRIEDRCEDLDEEWAQSFRDWLGSREDRERAPGTIENGLIQLAAALRFGGVEPGFQTIPTIEVNRTPAYRADVETIAAMFRFAMSEKRRSDNLLRFLRASVATWARPDAVYDINTAAKRRQWFSNARVLALNPDGRKQTKKYRPTIPVAHQFAAHLDGTKGVYLPVTSIKTAWKLMEAQLKLPGQGESGQKLIRRSVSTIARKRLGEEHWVQGKMMLGHHKASTSDIYALPDPVNLGRALAVTEAIIDEIEALAPGAFYRTFTADDTKVVPITNGKKT